MGFAQKISFQSAPVDLFGLVNMIDLPSCTMSLYSRSNIAQNQAFELLFKGMHPLDVLSLFPERIKEDIASDAIIEKKEYRNIELFGKRFSRIEILPVGREYLLKFHVSRSVQADYKQIFEIIYDNSPLGMLLVDKNQKFIAANKAMSEMTGYSIDELKRMTFLDLTHPDDIERNLPLSRKLYSEEIDTLNIQKRYIRKDGNIISVNIVMALTKDPSGEFLGGVGIVEDVTNRLKTEEQRDQLLHSLREKNKEIVDSLAYARNIQNALLPRSDDFEQYFKKHFIYYKQRDIVGGDFYWIRSSRNKVYFAVADCTGHGVPGAFISLIGNYRLNLIYEKYKDASPGVLLEKLNNIIAYSFRNPSYSVAHHGMDIAMCCFDLTTGELQYAGANNSLILVRKGLSSDSNAFPDSPQYRLEDDLLEVKADKHSIGTYSSRFKFTTHQINVKKGDRLYLFSDGYPDQFGGEKAKKLKMKEFKRILKDGLKMDLKEQAEALHEFRLSWQGDLQQIDDICVLGVAL